MGARRAGPPPRRLTIDYFSAFPYIICNTAWKGLIPMERYYQPEIETASREQIRAWQDERLVKQVRNVWDNVPYYRKKMEEKGLTPDDILKMLNNLAEYAGLKQSEIKNGSYDKMNELIKESL